MKSLPIWLRDDGSVVSCAEKIKVMRENFEEIKQIAQDALEDGLLLEVSETQMREALHHIIDQLVNPYQKSKAAIEKSYPN
jgi:regulator of replication initiation timing